MSALHTGQLEAEDTETQDKQEARAFLRKQRWAQISLRLWQFGVLIAALVAWQLVYHFQLLDSVILRSPGQVFGYLRDAIEDGELQDNTWATMQAVVTAFALAGIVGIVAGLTLGLLPRVNQVLSPFLDAVNAMPRIALAPVFIVWLGIGVGAKVALAFSLVVFIVLANTQAGVKSADSEIVRLSWVLGTNRLQLFVKVLLPVAVPSIFAGLRLGLIYALLAVVGSEIIAAQNGLGQRVAYYSSVYKLEAVYGMLLVLAAIAAILNMLMSAAERWLLRWQPPNR